MLHSSSFISVLPPFLSKRATGRFLHIALHFTLSVALMESSFPYSLGALVPMVTSHMENSFLSFGGSKPQSGNSYSEFFSTSSSSISPFPPPASKVILTIFALVRGSEGFFDLDFAFFSFTFLPVLLFDFERLTNFFWLTLLTCAALTFFLLCFEEAAMDGINTVISIASVNVKLNTLGLIFIARPYPFH